MTLFNHIQEVHARTEGWCSWQKAETLSSIVLALRPALCVEIGVWYGRSLFPVAQALQHVGSGKVLAIDPWLAGCSVAGQVNQADVEWWNRQSIHEDAYKGFLAGVERLQLKPFVDVHRMHSDEYDPEQRIGLLSVDGNHGVQAIKDMQRYAPAVERGGFLVADDIQWSGGAVEQAVNGLGGLGFIHLYTVDDKQSQNKWPVFQRA